MGSVAFDDLKWAVGSIGMANDCFRVPVNYMWGRGGDGVEDCLVLLTTFPLGKKDLLLHTGFRHCKISL